jgi:hypothetical protein
MPHYVGPIGLIRLRVQNNTKQYKVIQSNTKQYNTIAGDIAYILQAPKLHLMKAYHMHSMFQNCM